MNAIANFVVLLACCLPSLHSRAAEPSESILAARITKAETAIQTSLPPNFVVTATAEFPTGGYSDFKLIRAVYVTPPSDGIQDYFFMATPPTGVVTQVITEGKATNSWKDYPAWVAGVRIHGTGDGILVRGLDNSEDGAGVTVVVPADGVRDFSIEGLNTLFRLTASVPAGGTIGEPQIEGGIQMVRTVDTVTVAKGGRPLIGSISKEFEFRAEVEGSAKIKIIRMIPGSATPEVDEYVIEVK